MLPPFCTSVNNPGEAQDCRFAAIWLVDGAWALNGAMYLLYQEFVESGTYSV